MASMFDSELFGDLFSTPEMRTLFSDATTVQKWLDVEAALARAEAKLGIIKPEYAEEITRKSRVELLDMQEMKRELVHTFHPIMPLIYGVKRLCKAPAGEYFHWGATTQDIMDTGTVLQLKDANIIIVRELTRTLDLLKDMAQRYRDTVECGRTHGQHALPITFGFKVARWASELKRHLQRLAEMAPRVFIGQFSGAVGTLASIGESGFQLQELMFADLGLGVPEISWHTSRDGIAEFTFVYALIGSTLAKIANEIIVLQRTEIAEMEEPFHMGKVGSSTMPHKRNPMMSESVLAMSKLIQMQVTPALNDVIGENERDMRGWQAEWSFLAETCCLLSGMLFWTNKVLAGLQVYPENMARNLDALHGLLLSENVMLVLGTKIGRQEAHELVYQLSMEAFEKKIPLKQLLLRNSRVREHMAEKEIDDLLNPAKYTGLSAQFVDRVTGKSAKAGAR
jgi:adenylosuccinate lyase